jgi:hypothetical protein
MRLLPSNQRNRLLQAEKPAVWQQPLNQHPNLIHESHELAPSTPSLPLPNFSDDNVSGSPTTADLPKHAFFAHVAANERAGSNHGGVLCTHRGALQHAPNKHIADEAILVD